ncbi:MAG: helix-turn-helix domain-containing protein [Actinomycetota bacterium]|nr:helix-turn-helix domain-containing protein [Actinomycetota bacterium]
MKDNEASERVGAVEMVLGRPSAALSPYVDRYVGYRQDRLASGTHQGLPSRSMTLVISLADPIRMLSMPDPTAAAQEFTGLIGGLHAGPVRIAADRFQFGIHVELSPWAAGVLLGHPAGVLASGVYDVADVLGGRGIELIERVRAAPDWASRFAALDRALGAPSDRVWTPAPEVAQAWTTLVRTGGRIPVDQLARRVGWSRRHMGERFRRELGLAPKAAGRVIRFQRSHRALTRPARAGLAQIAADCGYADQAHMTREWRDLAGQTPTAWMAAELPFVQDAVDEPATFSAHG